jgi:hypothetical protein
MSNMDVQDRLLRAMGKREPVRVSRNIRKTGDVGGYVLAVGTEWVLVALLQDVALNGFVALRLNDVTGVKRGYAPKFYRRALELHGEWPPVALPGDIMLDGIRELVESAAGTYPLVTIHIEREDPGVCFIGAPVKFSRRRLHLLEVTAKAKWRASTSKWDLTAITRVDFDGRYERALLEVAGSPDGNGAS